MGTHGRLLPPWESLRPGSKVAPEGGRDRSMAVIPFPTSQAGPRQHTRMPVPFDATARFRTG